MSNPLCKIGMSALASLLVAIPAAAADLVPYDNGYIPQPYDSAGAYTGYPGYGSHGLYEPDPHNCGPNSEPLADDRDGRQGACVPGYRLPNGPDGGYSYHGDYPAGPPHNDRYGDYPDQSGYRPDRQPSAIPRNDRYGETSQRGYGAGPTPPPIAPGEYPNQRGYGPDRPARYGGYPPQPAYGPARLPTPTNSDDYSPQRGYEAGRPPYSAFPPNNPYGNSY
jgi:hypothetical protein